jgi:organic radical activating enzyme
MIDIAPLIEFYITNECNLACSNCNRFNNYDFQGHYYWKDSAELLEKWSKRITTSLITIIGGEPTLHPELETWAYNLRRLWPRTPIIIQSNGINAVDQDYYWKNYSVGFSISAHSVNLKSKLQSKWISPNVVNLEKIQEAWMFTDSAVINAPEGLKMHNSNPEIAFENCTMKHSHTMLNGLLYKCPLVAVLPEFVQQQSVDLNDRLSLLTSYQSLHPDCSDRDLELFKHTRNQHIPQCALCPEKYNPQPVVLMPRPPRRKI